MHVPRRLFLKISLSSWLLGWWRWLPARSDTAALKAFPACIDTLLPQHAGQPGALALGVHDRVLAKAKADPDYWQLLSTGCAWLDGQALSEGAWDFSELAPEQRERIIARAEKAQAGSMPRVFFQRTLEEAMRDYYTRRETWYALGYSGPPQPLGFMDFKDPPGARSFDGRG